MSGRLKGLKEKVIKGTRPKKGGEDGTICVGFSIRKDNRAEISHTART